MDWGSKTTMKHIKEARAQGCTLRGPGKSAHYRLYTLPCKHKEEVDVSKMRLGKTYFKCKTCMHNKHVAEAID